jgi:hypothetical protein
MKKLYILLIALVWMTGAKAQGCLPEGITFTTQEEIDNFQTNYPGCTEIEGYLTISGDFINNLNGLIVLTTIGSSLSILNAGSLPNLTGLNNLTSIGEDIIIHNNYSLTSLTGLNNLTSIGSDLHIYDNWNLASMTGLNNLNSIGEDLLIDNNYLLTSLTGVDNLTSIGGELYIGDNNNLTSLTGLGNLTSIGSLGISGNGALTSLTGLDNLTSTSISSLDIEGTSLTSLTGLEVLNSIGGTVFIADNNNLTSLTGLENLTSIGEVYIAGNNNLTSLSEFNNLKYISSGVLYLIHNDILTSLTGLDNIEPSTIVDLEIYFNPSLSNCAIQSICDYLISPTGYFEIQYNAPGCNSPEEVEADCLTKIEENTAHASMIIIPNPANNHVAIEIPSTEQILSVELRDLQSRLIKKRDFGSGSKALMDVYDVPKGLYLVKIISDKNIYSNKVIID